MSPGTFDSDHSLRCTTFDVTMDRPLEPGDLARNWPRPLKIDKSGREVLMPGEEIAAAGWPSPQKDKGGQRVLHMDKLKCLASEMGHIKSRAWIHAGSSGGPCVNTHGEVIGVNSFTDRYNISYFRSVRYLRPNNEHPNEHHGLADKYLYMRRASAEQLPACAQPIDYPQLSTYELTLDDPAVELVVDLSTSTYELRQRLSKYELRPRTSGEAAASLGREEPLDLVRQPSLAVGNLSPLGVLDEEYQLASINCRRSWSKEGVTHAVFAYPEESPAAPAQEAGERPQLDERMDGLRLGGGFLYLRQQPNGRLVVVGAKVIGKRDMDNALRFSSPKPLSSLGDGLDRATLQAKGWMRDVTFTTLHEMGVRQLCWLPPGVLDPPHTEKTGFAYLYEEAECRHDCVFWLEPPSTRFVPLC